MAAKKKVKHYSDDYVDALHRELAAYEKAIRVAHECLEAIRTCSAEKVIVDSAETGVKALSPIMPRLAEEQSFHFAAKRPLTPQPVARRA